MAQNDVVSNEVNYTQQDVQEVARAFTGWTLAARPVFTGGPFTEPPFFIDAANHDNGVKTIFGQGPANFGGEDVIDMICSRPATARFITKKLYEFFVHPLTDSSEDKNIIERFAAVYLERDHSIKELIRAILVSDNFFGDRARFALKKSPVEFMISAARMLEMWRPVIAA